MIPNSDPGTPEGYISEIPAVAVHIIEEAAFTSRSGEKYWVLRHPAEHTYIRLDERDYFIWSRIDGVRNYVDILIEYLHVYQALPFDRLDHLIETLTAHKFLDCPPFPEETRIHCPQNGWLSNYWEIKIPLPGMDQIFSLLYQGAGWVFRIPCLSAIFILFCLCGAGYFFITEPLPNYPILLGGDSDLLTIISIYLIVLISAIFHECGHAIACLAYGRSLKDAGLLLYYGSPCMYIDTTDIWMAPRRARVMVSLAGPAVNIFIGSLCSLIVLVMPDSQYSTFIWRISFICYIIALINLNPLLEFDGYYALADILEISDLRARAFSYIRSFSLIDTIRGRFRIDRTGWIFLLYGVSSALFTLAIVLVGIYFWQEHVTDLITELQSNTRSLDHILASLAIILVFVPFIAGMMISFAARVKEKIIMFLSPAVHGTRGDEEKRGED